MPASAEYFTSMYYPAVLITHTNLILKEFGLNSGARREIEQIMFIVKWVSSAATTCFSAAATVSVSRSVHMVPICDIA